MRYHIYKTFGVGHVRTAPGAAVELVAADLLKLAVAENEPAELVGGVVSIDCGSIHRFRIMQNPDGSLCLGGTS